MSASEALIPVKDIDELIEALMRLRRQGNLPVYVRVDAGNRWHVNVSFDGRSIGITAGAHL